MTTHGAGGPSSGDSRCGHACHRRSGTSAGSTPGTRRPAGGCVHHRLAAAVHRAASPTSRQPSRHRRGRTRQLLRRAHAHPRRLRSRCDGHALPRHQTYAPLRVRRRRGTGCRSTPVSRSPRSSAAAGSRRSCSPTAGASSATRSCSPATGFRTTSWPARPDCRCCDGAKSPIVDSGWHTAQPGVFAIGNLTHPAETADVCALDGRAAAAEVMDWLTLQTWPTAVTPIAVEPPLLWAAHTAVGITLRVAEFVEGRIECRSGRHDRPPHQTQTLDPQPSHPPPRPWGDVHCAAAMRSHRIESTRRQ